MKTIIATVGTSIFTNLTKDGENEKIARKYEDLKELRFSDWNNTNEPTINELRTLVNAAIKKEGEKASAEIESILKIAKGENVIIHLLATDTILSVLAAEIIKDWFKDKQTINFSSSYQEDVIENLVVTNKVTFEKGLNNLFSRIDAIIPEKKGKKDWSSIVFNITGGYKAIIPHLTILAQVHRCPIYYIFSEGENNSEPDLIEVPTLPINFDWLVAEIYGHMLSRDSTLQKHLESDTEKETLQQLIDYGLATKDKTVNIFGKLMWRYLNGTMAESPSVLGYFVEMKVYEYFNENRGIYTQKPERSVNFYWDNVDESNIQAQPLSKKWSERTEVDLILRTDSNEYALVEVKSVMKLEEFIGDNKIGKRIDTKIKTLTTFYKKPPKSVIIVAHKNSKFEIDSESKEILINIKTQCENIDCHFYSVDFEANRKKETLNFSDFLSRPIELKEIIETHIS